jgi:hypothetical protein
MAIQLFLQFRAKRVTAMFDKIKWLQSSVAVLVPDLLQCHSDNDSTVRFSIELEGDRVGSPGRGSPT